MRNDKIGKRLMFTLLSLAALSILFVGFDFLSIKMKILIREEFEYKILYKNQRRPWERKLWMPKHKILNTLMPSISKSHKYIFNFQVHIYNFILIVILYWCNHRYSQIALDKLIKPWLQSETIFSFTADGKEYPKLLQTLHKFTDDVGLHYRF